MNEYFNTGQRILELRLKCGLSQEQLALHADITPTYLGQVERNMKNPTIRTIEKICFAMNLSLADFFCTATNQKEFDTFSLQFLSQISNRTNEEKKLILSIIKQILNLKDSV